jgi:hypothetical protein
MAHTVSTYRLKFGDWFTGRLVHIDITGTFMLVPQGIYHLETGELYDPIITHIENYREVSLKYTIHLYDYSPNQTFTELPKTFCARYKNNEYSIYVCQKQDVVLDILKIAAFHVKRSDFSVIRPAAIEIEVKP